MINFITVTFPIVKSGNQFVYPDDKSLFKNTVDDGSGNFIAGYSGVMSLTLADYPDEYKTLLTSIELMELVGVTDYDSLNTEASGGDAEAIFFLALIDSGSVIETTEPTFISLIGHFLTQGYITLGKHDDILQGAKII